MGELMNTNDLIKWVKRMIKDANKDMKECMKHGMYEDYAYAEGARNSYQVMLHKLTETKED
jgi:hypothetical protein